MKLISFFRKGQPRFGLALTVLALTGALVWYSFPGAFAQGIGAWQRDFPLTDFETRSIELSEIDDDGNVRDSIPPVVRPVYVDVDKIEDIGPLEPVLSIGINGDFRAYPLRILLWHEIVNEDIGGVPVLISYCPLCNSGVVFDRRVEGRVLEFGNTGRLRHKDMVMYDKQTESWWQQFTGQSMIGSLTGQTMKPLAARLESLEKFRARAPNGKVLVPEDEGARPYGASPYVGMDSPALPRAIAQRNFPYDLPDGVRALERIVVVGEEAWTIAKLSASKRIEAGDLILTWDAGQNSVHDTQNIRQGRDVGNVVVQRRTGEALADVPYDVSFAFAFSAFVPDGKLNF